MEDDKVEFQVDGLSWDDFPWELDFVSLRMGIIVSIQ